MVKMEAELTALREALSCRTSDKKELAVSTNVVRVGSEKEQMVLLKLLQDRKIIVSYYDW